MPIVLTRRTAQASMPPVDEQRRLVEIWHQSDDSMAAFARAHRVRPGTFATWVSRLRVPETPLAFLRIAAPADASSFVHDAVASPGLFMVQAREHLLRFEQPPPTAWIAAVLRELASC
jgi:transposase-like protein